MDIQKATKLYERWLSDHIDLVKPDIDRKHEQMAAGAFPFLRATYYRWAQTWQEICPELISGPVVLSVADLHVENYGTWRDLEGRLVWGINDFDEAFQLPWAADVLRLATSAVIAIDSDHLSIGRSKACDAILQGYKNALSTGGKPFVLAEVHEWLRKLSLAKARQPAIFWRKLNELATWEAPLPPSAQSALLHLLPLPDLEHRVVHRVAGLGSLGRHRFVAIADWCGGRLAREAKALAPSACLWASDGTDTNASFQQQLLDGAVRVKDPYLRLSDGWIVRRLATDCIRVELASLPTNREESLLLHSMGFELGNVHLSSPETREAILQDLDQRPENWLLEATKLMCKQVTSDLKEWRKNYT